MQLQVSSKSMRQHARDVLLTSASNGDHRLNLIALAMHGGKLTAMGAIIEDLKDIRLPDSRSGSWILAYMQNIRYTHSPYFGIAETNPPPPPVDAIGPPF